VFHRGHGFVQASLLGSTGLATGIFLIMYVSL
jgi:hypothetical protein